MTSRCLSSNLLIVCSGLAPLLLHPGALTLVLAVTVLLGVAAIVPPVVVASLLRVGAVVTTHLARMTVASATTIDATVTAAEVLTTVTAT